MFSNKKMEEYLKSGLSGIFRVNLVFKCIVPGPMGTQSGVVSAV